MSSVSGSFSNAQIAPERGRFHLPLQCLLPQATCRDSNSRGGLIHASLPETHKALANGTLTSEGEAAQVGRRPKKRKLLIFSGRSFGSGQDSNPDYWAGSDFALFPSRT